MTDPYALIPILYFAVATLLIVLCFVVEWVCDLKEQVRELGWQAADAEARFWELEEDLKRIRQQESIRRTRERDWLERERLEKSSHVVRDDGTEEPIKVRRSL